MHQRGLPHRDGDERRDQDERPAPSLEIRVIEEPPVRDPEKLPEAATDASWTPPSTNGPARKVTGGSSFDDAPLLKPGSYRDAIVPGEVLTYQVDAGWGQNVSATVDFPQAPTKLAEAIGNADMFARLDVFGPTRASAGVTGSAGAPTSQAFLFGSAQGGQQFGIVTTAVTYLNRGGQQPQAGASLAGRYTITFFLEPDPQRESYLVPFTLHVGVNGQPVPRPRYVKEPVRVDPPTTSAPPTPSDVSSPPQSTPDQGQDQDPENASTDSDSGFGAGIYLVAAGVLALLLLLVAGYLVARSRNRQAR